MKPRESFVSGSAEVDKVDDVDKGEGREQVFVQHPYTIKV